MLTRCFSGFFWQKKCNYGLFPMQLAELAGFPVKVLVSFRNQMGVMGFPASVLLCALSGCAKGSPARSILPSKESRLQKAQALEVSRGRTSAKK